MPRVSVIIRSKNEERYLGETLAAVRRQQFRDAETIVVDSGSTDDTVAIAERAGATIVHIEPHRFTYGRALNLGVGHASGELLVSLSAHATPQNEGWLGYLVAAFARPNICAVYGRHIPRSNVTPFELLGMRVSGVTSGEPRFQGRSARFSNTNGAFRRDLWTSAPFDESLPGAEDIEWARRMQRAGYVVAYEPLAAVLHSHGEPLPKLIRRQLHDQPVILRAWLSGLRNGHTSASGSDVDGREALAK